MCYLKKKRLYKYLYFLKTGIESCISYNFYRSCFSCLRKRMLLGCALKYAFDNVSNNVLSLQMRINMQCSQYEYFPRVCCARTRAVRLHQTIQHEVLPFCSEDPTGAEWKRHQVSYSPARCNLKPNVTFFWSCFVH